VLANRERSKRKEVYLSDKEIKMIKEKMLQVGATNFSLYARKMLIDGYVIKRVFSEFKELTKELANLARSINQIAKNIYEQDVKDFIIAT